MPAPCPPAPSGGLVDPRGYPISSASGRFLDAADTSSLNRPALLSRLEDINRLVPAYDRRIIVGACERIVSNFDVVEGALWMKAMYAVGRAWEPEFLGDDQAWGEEAKDWLVNEWYKIADLEGAADLRFNLELDSVTLDRSGDFLIFLTSFAGGYPATQRIPAWRIGQPFGADQMVISVTSSRHPDGTPASAKGQPVQINLPVPMRLRDGFIYDVATGRKLYCRLRVDNGLNLAPTFDFVDIHARDFIHCFDRAFYGQGRGWPALTASANKLRDLLKAHEWEQLALLIASSIGLIEYNETGTQENDDRAAGLLGGGNAPGVREPFQSESFFGGLVRYFKAGSGAKLQQFVNERPGPIWESFADRIIHAAMRGMGWSPMLAWGKTNPGGQLARSDIDQCNTSVRDRQDVLRTWKLREDGYGLSKAMQLEILPPYKGKDLGGFLKWGYSFPGEIDIDDGRTGQNLREDYKIGFVNDRKVFAIKGGKTVKMHWAERADDVAARKLAAWQRSQQPDMKAANLTVDERDMQMLTANEQPNGDAGSGEVEPGSGQKAADDPPKKNDDEKD